MARSSLKQDVISEDDSMADITISAFKWVPPFAQGLVRDLRVRWALEEAGLPYRLRLLGPGENRSADYRLAAL